MIKSTKRIKAEDLASLKVVTLPTNTYTKYLEAKEKIDNVYVLNEKDLKPNKKLLTNNDLMVIGASFAGQPLANNTITEAEEFNDITDDIKPKPVDIKLKNKQLKGKNASVVARMFLSKAGMVAIPLYHSGFWVILNPATITDRLTFERNLIARRTEVGLNTLGLGFSSDIAVYSEVVYETVEALLHSTTLILGEEDSLKDYISILDIETLVLVLMASFYPEGFDISLACSNTLEVDDEGIKCDYVIKGKADVLSLLKRDDTKLTEEQLAIMNKRGKNSVTPEEVAKYKDEYSATGFSRILRYKNNNNELKIYLKDTNFTRFQESNSFFMSEIEALLESILTNETDAEKRIAMINEELSKLNLVKLLHFIEKIEVSIDDNITEINDTEGIYSYLIVLIDDEELGGTIVDDIIKFIKETMITVIGTPTYTCPSCREQASEGGDEPFKEIVPLNVYEVFSYIRAMK